MQVKVSIPPLWSLLAAAVSRGHDARPSNVRPWALRRPACRGPSLSRRDLSPLRSVDRASRCVAGAGRRARGEPAGPGRFAPRAAERLVGHPAGPAHPHHRQFRVIAELLRYPLRAAQVTERPHGRGHGPPDLPGGELLRSLQGRNEQGVGPDGADADVVNRWLHGEPPREPCTSTAPRGYDISGP